MCIRDRAKAGRGLVVALLLFVGIPLPGTGAWTGTLAGSILDMKFKDVLIACKMCIRDRFFVRRNKRVDLLVQCLIHVGSSFLCRKRHIVLILAYFIARCV